MRFLRVIWKDIQYLYSLPPAIKIPGVILVLGLIFGAWYVGSEWWQVEAFLGKSGRRASRQERIGVMLGISFLVYITVVIERGRKSP